MKKVFVILGQTATGKSNLAVKIALRLCSGPSAQKLGGEIISADSRQVYKSLNIGTGKITAKEMHGIPHHLLDVVNPKKKFSVTEYQKLAEEKIKEIINKNKIPIICGGTGFYIDAITKGIIFLEVPPNWKLRKKLALVDDRLLMLKLQKLDPERAKNIDAKNKVRLIRAIEIAKALGKVPPLKQYSDNNVTNSAIAENVSPYRFIKIGLYLPEDKLKKKIKIRLEKRMKMGMLNEAKKLHEHGLSWKRMEELGLEYRFMALHLQNKISKKEMLDKLNSEIYKYAKRQMTWFKRDKSIKWYDASKPIKIKDIF
ncbi:MAG: tRNA (adenosine(37)-N6)-dimethylallyltransferase MiaA [Patescibacteria group bacterium]